MSRILSSVVLAVAVSVPAAAFAQDIDVSEPVVSRGGQGWSLYSGQTVGAGSDVLSAQVGWPALSVGFLHGATRNIDLGVKFTPLQYGYESRVRQVELGMKLQLVARLGLIQQSRFNLGLEFAPGPGIYYDTPGPSHDTLVGLALPLRLAAGVPVGSAIMLNFGMDMPMFVRFGYLGGLYLPFLFGGGAEYFIDRKMSVSFNLKMGPSIFTPTGNAEFAMDALIGLGYKL